MNEALFLSLINSRDIPIIDLHDCYSPDEAIDKLEKELFSFSKKENNFVKIIYGIGKGVLKKHVIDLMGRHPLVKDYKVGEDGFCVVEL